MRVIVNAHYIEIEKEELINEKESHVSDCTFEFDKRIADDFTKEAYFTKNNQTYKVIIINNKCDYPSEILQTDGDGFIGVVAYKITDNEIIRFNPTPTRFEIEKGSLKVDAENSKPITPTELEQYQQSLNNGLNEVREELKVTQKIGDDVQKIGAEAQKQSNYAKTQGDYAKEQGDYANQQGLKAENIANVVQNKLDNNEFIGPQGPQGEKGDKGEKGDCNFATFDVVDGKLIMYKTDDILLDFRINDNKLEVII